MPDLMLRSSFSRTAPPASLRQPAYETWIEFPGARIARQSLLSHPSCINGLTACSKANHESIAIRLRDIAYLESSSGSSTAAIKVRAVHQCTDKKYIQQRMTRNILSVVIALAKGVKARQKVRHLGPRVGRTASQVFPTPEICCRRWIQMPSKD